MTETPPVTPAMVARDLAQVFGERTYAAHCLLVRAFRELGTDAAYDLAARASFIDATGGLPLGEPWNRKRTLGGVFFYLLKGELDDEQHRRVFGRVRKTGAPQDLTQGTTTDPELQIGNSLPVPEPVVENVRLGAQIDRAPKRVKPKAPQPAPDPSRPCAACEQPTAVVGKFHFGRAGKRYLCAPCVDLGFVFGPTGEIVCQELVA